MARALRPGARLALSAFNAYFRGAATSRDATFDAASGVNHERTEIRDPTGNVAAVDLWTTCFTPRELRLLCDRAGLRVASI